jgi:uncharacterized membrane protein YdjX (TVP38/TMEM64 family)
MEFRVFRRSGIGNLIGISVKRIGWVVGAVGFGLVIWFGSSSLRVDELLARYSEFKIMLQDDYSLSLVVFFLTYVLAVSLSLPIASLLTLMGAALFGWIALPIIVLSATTGAMIVFLLASTFARQLFTKRAGGVVETVQETFHKSPIRWLLTMRFIPFFPFWLVNIIPALLQMRLRDFALATAVGIIPGTAIYVGVGKGLDTVLERGLSPQWNLVEHPEVWLPLVLLGAFSAASAVISNRYKQEVH